MFELIEQCERHPFGDLTKINKPFGSLTIETQRALQNAARRGHVIEFKWGHVHWSEPITEPCWDVDCVYRVRPEPTKPSLDWSQVADKWIAFARDEDGRTAFYTTVPYADAKEWLFTEVGEHHNVDDLLKIDPGTCDWKDSLVLRPEDV